jgi:hypothetical protein
VRQKSSIFEALAPLVRKVRSVRKLRFLTACLLSKNQRFFERRGLSSKIQDCLQKNTSSKIFDF